MKKFRIDLKPQAKIDFGLIYKSGDKFTIKRIEKILLDLEIHSTLGTGNPEQLKYNLSGLCSRRINKKDRIV